MNKKILLGLALTALSFGAQAKVKLPHLVSDNMIIQQQTDVRLWGWAKAGSMVVATTSWSDQRAEVKADKEGRWLLTVKSPKASYEPLSITFDDGDGKVVINNVLSGEVWVCAGQSNMEMPVKGFGNCPVLNYNQEVLHAAGKCQVRSAKIPSIMRMKPQEDADTYWRECSPQTVGEFSATGYFFAKVVNQALDIPIGLIEANKGGSRVESWITKENLEKYTKEPTDSMGIVNFKKEWDYHRALVWGNGTFNPILNYTVKGILFYQGCSNVGDPGNQYRSSSWVTYPSTLCRLLLTIVVTSRVPGMLSCRNSSSGPLRLFQTADWSAPTMLSIRMRVLRYILPRSRRLANDWHFWL